jgi:hypothetical protein
MNTLLGLILYGLYVLALLTIGSGILLVEGYQKVEYFAFKYIPYCYWDWVGMFLPAFLTR